LCFFDETGLNLNPNVPYAWQEKGTTALLPAQRTKGITLLGILNPVNNKLTVNRYEGAANAKCVIQTLDEFSLNLSKKTILILDNASIHKAGIVKQQEKKWRQRGLFLQFIPAYSPELNLIEILWKRLKHSWLKPQYYRSLEYLIQQTDHILRNYGKHYTISFF
jgi:transposase